MKEELKQFFEPWELKILEIIEEAKKEDMNNKNFKIKNLSNEKVNSKKLFN